MKTQPSKERAESRVVNRYHKLYIPLVELIDSLQDLDPGGTLVDDIKLTQNQADKKILIQYKAHPVKLTIDDGKRAFVLQIINVEK